MSTDYAVDWFHQNTPSLDVLQGSEYVCAFGRLTLEIKKNFSE